MFIHCCNSVTHSHKSTNKQNTGELHIHTTLSQMRLKEHQTICASVCVQFFLVLFCWCCAVCLLVLSKNAAFCIRTFRNDVIIAKDFKQFLTPFLRCNIWMNDRRTDTQIHMACQLICLCFSLIYIRVRRHKICPIKLRVELQSLRMMYNTNPFLTLKLFTLHPFTLWGKETKYIPYWRQMSWYVGFVIFWVMSLRNIKANALEISWKYYKSIHVEHLLKEVLSKIKYVGYII